VLLHRHHYPRVVAAVASAAAPCGTVASCVVRFASSGPPSLWYAAAVVRGALGETLLYFFRGRILDFAFNQTAGWCICYVLGPRLGLSRSNENADTFNPVPPRPARPCVCELVCDEPPLLVR
jgi:hypothetical protein